MYIYSDSFQFTGHDDIYTHSDVHPLSRSERKESLFKLEFRTVRKEASTEQTSLTQFNVLDEHGVPGIIAGRHEFDHQYAYNESGGVRGRTKEAKHGACLSPASFTVMSRNFRTCVCACV